MQAEPLSLRPLSYLAGAGVVKARMPVVSDGNGGIKLHVECSPRRFDAPQLQPLQQPQQQQQQLLQVPAGGTAAQKRAAVAKAVANDMCPLCDKKYMQKKNGEHSKPFCTHVHEGKGLRVAACFVVMCPIGEWHACVAQVAPCSAFPLTTGLSARQGGHSLLVTKGWLRQLPAQHLHSACSTLSCSLSAGCSSASTPYLIPDPSNPTIQMPVHARLTAAPRVSRLQRNWAALHAAHTPGDALSCRAERGAAEGARGLQGGHG